MQSILNVLTFVLVFSFLLLFIADFAHGLVKLWQASATISEPTRALLTLPNLVASPQLPDATEIIPAFEQLRDPWELEPELPTPQNLILFPIQTTQLKLLPSAVVETKPKRKSTTKKSSATVSKVVETKPKRKSTTKKSSATASTVP